MEIPAWIETQVQKLNSKTQGYTEKEKSKAGYSYLKNALYLVPEKIADETTLQEFKAKSEHLIDTLPIKQDGGKLEYGSYPSALSSYKNEIKKEYNMVSKGTYLNQGALGMPVGFILGLLFGSIIFGMLIGLTAGMAMGSALENKAKKENRLL